MGFLPIFYVGFFCFIELAVYTALAIVAGLDSLGKRLAAAVLAFGAAGAVAYILISLLLPRTEPLGPDRTVFVLTYFVPGLLGAWFTFARFRKGSRTSNCDHP